MQGISRGGFYYKEWVTSYRETESTIRVGCVNSKIRKYRMWLPCVHLGQQKKEFKGKKGMGLRVTETAYAIFLIQWTQKCCDWTVRFLSFKFEALSYILDVSSLSDMEFTFIIFCGSSLSLFPLFSSLFPSSPSLSPCVGASEDTQDAYVEVGGQPRVSGTFYPLFETGSLISLELYQEFPGIYMSLPSIFLVLGL